MAKTAITSTDFIPTRDDDFFNFQKNLRERLHEDDGIAVPAIHGATPNFEKWGIPPAAVTELDEAGASYEPLYHKSQNKKIPDSERALMGLTVPDTEPLPVHGSHLATLAPVVGMKNMGGATIDLRLRRTINLIFFAAGVFTAMLLMQAKENINCTANAAPAPCSADTLTKFDFANVLTQIHQHKPITPLTHPNLFVGLPLTTQQINK